MSSPVRVALNRFVYLPAQSSTVYLSAGGTIKVNAQSRGLHRLRPPKASVTMIDSKKHLFFMEGYSTFIQVDGIGLEIKMNPCYFFS